MSEKRTRQLTPEERARRIAYRKKRKVIVPVSRISFLLHLALSVIFLLVLKGLGFIPNKYLIILAVLLGVFNVFYAIIAFATKASNSRKITQSVICAVMSVLLTIGSIIVPNYVGTIQKMFGAVPTEGEMNINVYVLKEKNFKSIQDMAGRKVGIQTKLDLEYQDYAISVVNKELTGNDIVKFNCNDIYDAVEKLYANNVEAIMLNETYAEIIEENEDYKDFSEKTEVLYTCIQKINLDYDVDRVGNITTEPFVIGVIGNDSWDLKSVTKTTKFRSDVNMLVAVNPTTKQILIVSVPRDSYVPIDGVSTQMDKLTHAPYLKGINGWIRTMESFLGVTMNYFVKINFSSMVNIVNALGGVDVNNPYEFSTTYVYYNGKKTPTTFPAGRIHLDGEQALGYVRERKSLKKGDLGRNEHQAIVMKAMIDKATSVEIISKISSLLKALSGDEKNGIPPAFFTSIASDQIFAIAQMQLNDMASWNMQSVAITGTTGMYKSWATGTNLSMVIPAESTVQKVKQCLNALMNGQPFNTES